VHVVEFPGHPDDAAPPVGSRNTAITSIDHGRGSRVKAVSSSARRAVDYAAARLTTADQPVPKGLRLTPARARQAPVISFTRRSAGIIRVWYLGVGLDRADTRG
jgi:hypothetical protein